MTRAGPLGYVGPMFRRPPPAGRKSLTPAESSAPPPTNRMLRSELRNAAVLALLVAGAFLFLSRADLLAEFNVMKYLPLCVAVSASVHLPQLTLTAMAWRVLVRHPSVPSLAAMTGLRWMRESAGTLLPGGGLLGQVWVARQLALRGVPTDLAGATATVDVTVEMVAQLLFTLLGLALFLARGSAGAAAGIAAAGCAVMAVGTAGLIAILWLSGHPVLAGLRRRLADRLPLAWRGAIANTYAAFRNLHADPVRLLSALAWHGLAWALGAVEVAAVLALIGHKVSLADATVIESMAQALRNAGFMLPGAAGVQEAAIVGAAALVGVPAGPALTASLVRRTREVLLALPGALALQRSEASGRRKPPAAPAQTAQAAD